jgi:hypothetical protein
MQQLFLFMLLTHLDSSLIVAQTKTISTLTGTMLSFFGIATVMTSIQIQKLFD